MTINLYLRHYNVADVIKNIHAGKIQVPEFMSNRFSWEEREILSFLELYYSGLHTSNILLITTGSQYNSLPRVHKSQTPECEVPARRFSRNISRTGMIHPVNRPVKKADHENIYYIVDGYHRLQCLYLAWYGMYERKNIYFNIGALNEPRFCFLTSAENKLKQYPRLSKVKNIFIEDPVAFLDQINKNCRWFKNIFYDTHKMSITIVNMNDLLFDNFFWASFDYNPQMKIIGERLKYISETYMTTSSS